MPKDEKIVAPDSQEPGSENTRRGRRGGGGPGGGRGPNKGAASSDDANKRMESEWEEKIIQVRRVTKVVKGGKKLSFRAVVAIGNGKGQVGIGVGKAAEVLSAIQKGVGDARKHLIKVPLIGTTIPHELTGKQGASRILLKPAAKGTGVIAGGAARAILELAGVGDVMSKSLGSRAPLNVARATINGLSNLRTFEQVARLRGMSLKQMLA
jgi:small subunit ribosomal protein S5